MTSGWEEPGPDAHLRASCPIPGGPEQAPPPPPPLSPHQCAAPPPSLSAQLGWGSDRWQTRSQHAVRTKVCFSLNLFCELGTLVSGPLKAMSSRMVGPGPSAGCQQEWPLSLGFLWVLGAGRGTMVPTQTAQLWVG